MKKITNKRIKNILKNINENQNNENLNVDLSNIINSYEISEQQIYNKLYEKFSFFQNFGLISYDKILFNRPNKSIIFNKFKFTEKFDWKYFDKVKWSEKNIQSEIQNLLNQAIVNGSVDCKPFCEKYKIFPYVVRSAFISMTNKDLKTQFNSTFEIGIKKFAQNKKTITKSNKNNDFIKSNIQGYDIADETAEYYLNKRTPNIFQGDNFTVSFGFNIGF